MTINEYYAKIRKLSIEEYEVVRKQEIRDRVSPKITGLDQIEDEVSFQYIMGNQEIDAEPIDLLDTDSSYEQPTKEEINQEINKEKQTINPEDDLFKESLKLITDLRAANALNLLGGQK